MSRKVFINLPVADLPRSIAFFTALGFSRNPQFTDDAGACFEVSDAITVMLLTHARFREFTPKAVCDTGKKVSGTISGKEGEENLVRFTCLAHGGRSKRGQAHLSQGCM